MSNEARILNALIATPPEDLQPSVSTTMEFARMLNEARILLDYAAYGDIDPVRPAITAFEGRCREQLGPMILPKPQA